MIVFGVLTPREAVAAVDFHTLALLFGMMIVIAHLRLAGFFRWLAAHALRWAHAPRTLLILVVWLSGALSALFVNDTVCLLLTPLVLDAALTIGRNPVPFLLAVAIGSNVGSVATIVGNPQNMMVASFSGLSYLRFLAALAPVALAGLALTSALLVRVYRRELAGAAIAKGSTGVRAGAIHRSLLIKSLIVAGLLLVALLLGVTPSLAALGATSVLLITRRVNPRRVYGQVNWALLVMFAGLFVVTEGVERAGLPARGLALVRPEYRSRC